MVLNKSPLYYPDKMLSREGAPLFNEVALEIFQFQYSNNIVYQTFVDLLQIKVEKVAAINEIPFLPVEFFKTHKVVSENTPIERVFLSSGTTGMEQSKHYVTDLSVYENSFRQGFRYFYGDPAEYCILALLPSYQEREGSSLIYMAADLIKQSGHKESGFYLNNTMELVEKLRVLDASGQKILLLGVSYALLEVAENFHLNLKNTIVMETGGMKGKRREIIREELHEKLCKSFGVQSIHSEYGMTELLSQAYSKGKGIFECPPWMRVVIRETNDPFNFIGHNRSGAINIIDFANINSCSFIATQDLGKTSEKNEFEVLGRFDNTDIRGCNLLIE